MEKLVQLLENAETLYIDYFNNFTSSERFAEYYKIDEMTANTIINLGRRMNHNEIELNF